MVLIRPPVPAIEAIESTAPAIDTEAERARLRYATEEGTVNEFLSLEHQSSGARWHAAKAWSRLSRTPGAAPPATARDANLRFIQGELREPKQLRIERDGEWWRVVGVAT
jgi:hypothetical protein